MNGAQDPLLTRLARTTLLAEGGAGFYPQNTCGKLHPLPTFLPESWAHRELPSLQPS